MNKIKYLLLFLSVFLLAKNVYAEEIEKNNSELGYRIVLEDDADLFSDEEENKLKDIMTSLTEYGNIAVKTININNSSSTDFYASNYYHQLFNNESGTLFLIDMDNREIYIFSDGSNYRVITKQKAYIITDNVYRYASSGDYYKCVDEALSEISTLLSGGKILEPMRYISNIILSLTISAFVTFGMARWFTRIKLPTSKSIMKKCNVNFNVNSIEVAKIGSHSVYSPISYSDSSYSGSGSSSDGGFSSGGSSGGGFSCGGFSGGGSSGGGGGHRF